AGSPSKALSPDASAASGGTNRITVPASPQSTGPGRSGPGWTTKSAPSSVSCAPSTVSASAISRVSRAISGAPIRVGDSDSAASTSARLVCDFEPGSGTTAESRPVAAGACQGWSASVTATGYADRRTPALFADRLSRQAGSVGGYVRSLCLGQVHREPAGRVRRRRRNRRGRQLRLQRRAHHRYPDRGEPGAARRARAGDRAGQAAAAGPLGPGAVLGEGSLGRQPDVQRPGRVGAGEVGVQQGVRAPALPDTGRRLV